MLRRHIPFSNTSKRLVSTTKFVLPELPYDYGELEPSISPTIMHLHHCGHHATYVNNLNTASAKLEEAVAKNDVTQIVQLQQVIKFNGGGHVNHSIFWKNLAPPKKGGGEPPVGELHDEIVAQYGSVENLQTLMANAAVGVQGSGWGWLGFDKTNKRLSITTTANQDPLEGTTGLVPLLGIDVWEHAYYLDVSHHFTSVRTVS